MKKYILLTALALALLLQGCLPSTPPSTDPPTTTTAPTTTPPATTAPPTTALPTTALPTTVTTSPIGDVDPELFADLTAKLGEPISWYNMALTCEYESPAELDLKMFFYNGFKDEDHKPTDQEYPLLKAKLQNKDNLDRMDLVRLPVSKMDAVLTECFGIQTKDIQNNGMLYLEETKCYYMLLNAAHYMLISEFTGAEKLEDGSIRIFYTESKKTYAVTLKPAADGYTIWSNLPV